MQEFIKKNRIIDEVSRFFDVRELVCPHIYNRWGYNSWQFLDEDYLSALLIIRRDILKTPMVCNFGNSHQRGMRCNRCNIVREKPGPYLSAHVLGKAGDFTAQGMSAEDARREIIKHSALLPCNIRLEDGVSWIHIDTLEQLKQDCKVYLFEDK